jgi:DNA-binding NarL/FixJ family response regulator
MRLLFETEADSKVIGEAGDGVEAVQAALRLQPDVVIMDFAMPALNGVEATREIVARLPRIKIVILSMYDIQTYVVDSLEAGALAYVLKKSTADELTYAVRQVLEGNIYLSPPLDELELGAYAARASATRDSDLYRALSERERQVFLMAAQGMSNPEIAGRLSIGVRTVETYRANMLKKMNLKNQTELVRYAVERKLIA